MSETDRRLKDQLNSNQVMRERMCLEVLSVQDHYSEIAPRLPKGGPDGGRDLQGYYKDELCFGAVGFVNDATDTDQHRQQIKGKFKDDLKNALKDKNTNPVGFVFFTNVGLTPNIRLELQKLAYQEGIRYCDVFDRERIRIALDSNRGYAIRFRYLDIPLSDAEQKDFFSAWADEINSVIGSGLKSVDKTTKRIQFLLEAQFPLDHLTTAVKLKSSIWEACEGEFFFQTSIMLRAHSDGLLHLVYGGGTNQIIETSEEWKAQGKPITQNSQYGFGFSSLLPNSPQYERFVGNVDNPEQPKNANSEKVPNYIRTSMSSGILEVDQTHLHFSPLSEPFIIRLQPTCKLFDLNSSWVTFECNAELAQHIEQIAIFGAGYELLKISNEDMRCEDSSYDQLKIPKEGKQEAESHEWVSIRPSGTNSVFTINLTDMTPRRYDWR